MIEEKPKSKKWLWILLLILILIIAGVAGYFWLRGSFGQTSGITGDLEVKAAKIDKEKAVTKTFGQAGGTMSTVAADGTLYTLTVSNDSLILSAEISMSPLTESPVNGIDKPTAGFGVYLSGDFKFIRNSYLTIQPNTAMPSDLDKTGATKWGRCTIASRGYDPEICAGVNKVVFAGGVEPGKVVVHAINNTDEKLVLLAPTIPMGEANIYNAVVTGPGAYFGTKITKSMAEKLAAKTFSDAFDYDNATEVLMHTLTLGGDIKPYTDRIKRFARSEGSYPRETLEGAILELAINDQEGYKERIADFKSTIDKNIANLRASFMPWARYAALMSQLSVGRKSSSTTTGWLLAPAKAAGDSGAWPPDLQDYDETAREDTGGSDYAETMHQNMLDGFRAAATSRFNSCSEKAVAIEALEFFMAVDEADRQAAQTILKQCADQCKTLEECEHMGNENDKFNNSDRDAAAAIAYRITAFLEQGVDCTSQVKKNLETYGQNFCN